LHAQALFFEKIFEAIYAAEKQLAFATTSLIFPTPSAGCDSEHCGAATPTISIKTRQ
jgi:hypothetical protein